MPQHPLDLGSKSILNLTQVDCHSLKVPRSQRAKFYSLKPSQVDLRALRASASDLPMNFAQFEAFRLRKRQVDRGGVAVRIEHHRDGSVFANSYLDQNLVVLKNEGEVYGIRHRREQRQDRYKCSILQQWPEGLSSCSSFSWMKSQGSGSPA